MCMSHTYAYPSIGICMCLCLHAHTLYNCISMIETYFSIFPYLLIIYAHAHTHTHLLPITNRAAGHKTKSQFALNLNERKRENDIEEENNLCAT